MNMGMEPRTWNASLDVVSLVAGVLGALALAAALVVGGHALAGDIGLAIGLVLAALVLFGLSVLARPDVEGNEK